MKVNNSQLEQLYKFTQKHFVEWYDVQIELVDHLANGIEAQWHENPSLSFDEALKLEFKKFGIMGFSDVIEEKTKALNKHYRKLVWQYFKAYFKLPKIIFTLFAIWAFYTTLTNADNVFWIILISCIILMIVPFKFMFNQSKRIKSLKKETNKKWLIDTTVMQLGGLIHIFNMGIYISVFLDVDSQNLSNTKLFVLSTVIVLFALVLYVSIFVVSQKLRKYIAKQYTDYKFL